MLSEPHICLDLQLDDLVRRIMHTCSLHYNFYDIIYNVCLIYLCHICAISIGIPDLAIWQQTFET